MTTALPVAEDRTQFIGGSDIAAILGVDPYKTRLQVWEEKVGIASPFEGNQHTQRGTRLEAIAAQEYEARYGFKLRRINRRLVHPEHSFLTARIDFRIQGFPTLVEVKCPSLGAYSKIKRQGLHEGHIAQLHHYLGLTHPELATATGVYADDAEWVIFCADQWDMVCVPVKSDFKLTLDMWERCIAFWNEYVLTRHAPPAVDADEERLELRAAKGEVETYDVRNDAAFVNAMQVLREAKQLAAETELLGEEARARVREVVGERTGLFLGPDFRLSYSMAKGRASFDAKALAGAKPFDRLAVGAILQEYWNSLDKEPSRLQWNFEQVIKKVGAATLDLTQFEKLGKPYPILRPTFYGGEG